MSTYLHPDLDDLRARLSEQGFTEAEQWRDDFTIWYTRGKDELSIDLPQGEIYDHVSVNFHFDTGISLLTLLGFPL